MIGKLFKLICYMVVLEILAFIGLGVWLVYDGMQDHYSHADAAIVMGYGEIKDGVVEPNLAARLDRANKLYGKGKFPLIIVSGLTPTGEDDEANAMQQYLVSHHVPASAIIQDHRAPKAEVDDTMDSLVATMNDEAINSVVLITDYYRLERLKLTFLHAGKKSLEQAPVGQWRKEDNMDILHENIAMYKDLYEWYAKPMMQKLSAEAQVEEKKLKSQVDEKIDSMRK